MNDELEDERRGIIKWFLDVGFGRRTATEDEERSAVHRLGTLNLRLRDEDDE